MSALGQHRPRRGQRRTCPHHRSGVALAGLALMLWQAPLPSRAVVGKASLLAESWRRIGSMSMGSVGERSGGVLAQAENGDIAVGDASGVSWWREDTRERAVFSEVRDLAFDSRGVLWIATPAGLYSWRRADRPQRRRLPGGENANRIHRIAVSHGALLLATEAGAYWSSDGKIFQSLRVSSAATAVSHVAIRAASFDRSADRGAQTHPGRVQAWFFGSGRLTLVRGLEASAGMRVTDVRSEVLPRPGSAGRPVDLVIDPSGRRLFFVFEDAIAWRSIEADPSVSVPAAWRFERPGLPPGAVIRRLGWAAGRVWIATDHGLLVSQSLKGPFQRAASPVGTSDCVDIEPRRGVGALALCRAGLFVLTRLHDGVGANRVASRPASPLTLPPDPPLEEIRRRALERAGLTARRAHGMWDRLRRRAFWPEIRLGLDVDFDFERERDDDQAFISGETRRLHDETLDRGRRYQAAIVFDWDLGDAVYPSESVSLSRELRQILSLRDDIADEINQLYFERQTIREKLSESARDSIDEAEATRLRWRARELDAGLDAWTGGWISRWRALQTVSLGPVTGPRFPLDHPGQTHNQE